MSKRHQQTCPIAEFLNIFGDAWTFMILRESFLGETRFTAFQRNTGISKNLLSERLSTLLDEGIIQREDIGTTGPRYAYQLTEKGRALAPVLVAMAQWGNEHVFGEGNEPLHLLEKGNGTPIRKLAPASANGTPIHWRDIVIRSGSGTSKAARLRFAQVK